MAKEVNGPHQDGRELLAELPSDLTLAAEAVARPLRARGKQAWVVGGTVRDLALGRPTADVDIVTDALPDEVEATFPRTVAVGRAFGVIVVVLEDGTQVEVATFREERGYSDRRRPDEITYADSPEVDARRRDFTCNALYLDPVDGRLCDPAGGLEDLEERVLRTVGDPAGRFREDGLRLMRMARFCASLGFDPAPGLVEAARAEGAALAGVSPERVLDELVKIARRGAAGHGRWRALQLLDEAGLAGRCIPEWKSVRVERMRALEEQGEPVDLEASLAVLLPSDPEAADAGLRALRASTELRRGVLSVREHAVRMTELMEGLSGDLRDPEVLGQYVELQRRPWTTAAQALSLAELRAGGVDHPSTPAGWESLARLASSAPDTPLELSASELMEMGIERGPRLGRGLERVRLASLGQAFQDHAGALEWARAHLT